MAQREIWGAVSCCTLSTIIKILWILMYSIIIMAALYGNRSYEAYCYLVRGMVIWDMDIGYF